MGWNASMTASSAIGTSITFTPGTSAEGTYATSSFTAPKKGIYRFTLRGSGGTNGLNEYEGASVGSGNYNRWAAGGAGGKTVGYLLLEKDQVVHVGAGGTCCAAFAASQSGKNLAAIPAGQLYFVAGGGGAGGSFGESYNNTGWNCAATAGGNGGGSEGAAGEDGVGGGTQSAGGTDKGDASGFAGGSGSYGTGGGRWRAWDNSYVCISGRGGDGYYGGAGGHGHARNTDPRSAGGYGGGGGSGYVKTGTLVVNGKTYTNTTTQGGGAAGGSEGYYSWGSLNGSQFAGESGSVEVTYYARAELPIKFNGNTVERMVFNGMEITSLILNGTKIFFERIKRRFARWYTLVKMASRLRIPI